MKRFSLVLSGVWFLILSGALILAARQVDVLALEPPLPAPPPTELPRIPGHQVGHLTNMELLDLWVAQDPANNDPLGGNYVLVDSHQLGIAWQQYPTGTIHHKLMEINEDLSDWTELTASCSSIGPQNASGLLTTLSADVTGDRQQGHAGGQDQLITFYRDTQNRTGIQVECRDVPCVIGPVSPTLSLDTYPGPTPGELVPPNFRDAPIASGDFDGDNQDEVVVGLWDAKGKHGALHLFESREGEYQLEHRASWPAPDGTDGLVVTAGDFNGDGRDELAVIADQPDAPAGGNPWLYILRVTGGGSTPASLVATASLKLTPPTISPVFYNIIAAERDLQNAGDELVLVEVSTIYQTTIRQYNVSPDLATVTRTAQLYKWEHLWNGPLSSHLATGDFNLDGIDEIVWVYYGSDSDAYAQVVRCAIVGSGAPFQLDLAQYAFNGPGTTFGPGVTVADFNLDLIPEVLVTYWTQPGAGGRPRAEILHVDVDFRVLTC